MNGVSLHRRLGLALAGGIAATWLLAALAAGLVVRHEMGEAYDSALQETAQRILPLALAELARRGAAQAGRDEPLDAHREMLTYLVRDRDGAVLLRSHHAEPEHFPPRPGAGFRNTATHRVYGELSADNRVVIEVADPLSHRRAAILEAVGVLVLPLVVVIPLSLAGMLWLVRRGLRPVHAFRAGIERRGGADLRPLLTGDVPAELAPVAAAVNDLLERLRRTLEAERSFTANSAHELRTPIAGALAQTQRLCADLPAGELRDRAMRIAGSLRDLTRLAEKLMQLARAEGGGVLAEAPGDLLPVLGHLVEEFDRGADAGRVVLSAEAGATLFSTMDPDAFAILVRNLVENALKHGRSDGRVDIDVRSPGLLSVRNSGPVVAVAHLPGLVQRFARGRTGADGAGLGLAIADTIARAAGGALDLHSPARDRSDGFEAVVRLPLPADY